VMIQYIRIPPIFRSSPTGRGSSPLKVKKKFQMFWQETSLLIFPAFLLSSCNKSINQTFKEIKNKLGGLEPAMSVSLLSTNVPLRLLNLKFKIQLLYFILQTLGKKLGALQTFTLQPRSSLSHNQKFYESVVQCKGAAHGFNVCFSVQSSFKVVFSSSQISRPSYKMLRWLLWTGRWWEDLRSLGALDLRLAWGLLPTVPFKESTSGQSSGLK